MRLSDIQRKDIINLNSGKKVGKIIDVEISDDGNILYFVVELSKLFRNIFNNEKEMNIKYSDINKIGEDVILVDI